MRSAPWGACGRASRAWLGRHSTYAREWFQNTHTGLVRSSVSSNANSSWMGLSRGLDTGRPSLYTTVLTTGVLMMGRLGNLWQRAMVRTQTSTRNRCRSQSSWKTLRGLAPWSCRQDGPGPQRAPAYPEQVC